MNKISKFFTQGATDNNLFAWRQLVRTATTLRGFTLIELLLVIAIIGMLATIVLTGLSSARVKARNSRRLADMRDIQKALELYYVNNGSYPDTNNAWRSQCQSWGTYAPDQVIPGLTPTYMNSMPADPSMKASANQNCYVYRSTVGGADYKILDYALTETSVTDYPAFIDPERNSSIVGNGVCGVTGNNNVDWAVWSSAATQCL